MKAPPIENNEGFYNIPIKENSKGEWYAGLYYRRLTEVYQKNNSQGTLSYDIYDKKYNVYHEHSNTKKIFNTKFKTSCHRLSILYGIKLEEIKSLPKELLSLWIQGSSKTLKIPFNILPKNLVSLTFRWTDFPYNRGGDFTSLKKLKVLDLGTRAMSILPKLPKSIVYLDCMGSSLWWGTLDRISLENTPNLKWLGLPTHCKNHLTEYLKKAKKEKKIKIEFGF